MELLWQPDWQLPPGVKAFITTSMLDLRRSSDQIQLQEHLRDCIGHPVDLVFLKQQHTNRVYASTDKSHHVKAESIIADAIITAHFYEAAIVRTADCVPVLFCTEDGDQVAAVHAGWKGLANGILKQSIEAFDQEASKLLAFIGPCICVQHYEVTNDFKQQFLALHQSHFSQLDIESHFYDGKDSEHQYCDLVAIAQTQLQSLGLFSNNICDSGICTFEDQKFFSYRKEQQEAGRFASLIFKTHSRTDHELL